MKVIVVGAESVLTLDGTFDARGQVEAQELVPEAFDVWIPPLPVPEQIGVVQEAEQDLMQPVPGQICVVRELGQIGVVSEVQQVGVVPEVEQVVTLPVPGQIGVVL